MSEQQLHICQRASTAHVLDFVWTADTFRADDVIAKLGLTRSTCLQALDALVWLGLVEEVPQYPTEVRGQGRPSRWFRLKADAGVLVGLDVGGHEVVAAATDLKGRTLGQVSVPIVPKEGEEVCLCADRRRRVASEALDAVLEAAQVHREDVLAVGVGVPAPVADDGQSPEDATGFWQAMNAGLFDFLNEIFPAVAMHSSALLAAMAEHEFGATQGCDNSVTLLSGWRFGAGAIVNGQLVRGRHGGAGELGFVRHMFRGEEIRGIAQIANEWLNREGVREGLPSDHPWKEFRGSRSLNNGLLVTAPSPDDPHRLALEDWIAERVAHVCVAIAMLYDPDRIVIDGELIDELVRIIALVNESLPDLVDLPAPEVVASTLEAPAVVTGGIAAARSAGRKIAMQWMLSRKTR